MTLHAIDDVDTQRLFTVFRDGDFSWTVGGVPALMSALGLTIIEEIAGKGSIAATPWGVPDTDAALLYHGDTVQSITVRVTSRATDDVDDRLAVIDAFATIAGIGTEVFGSATAAIPGAVPRIQWRRDRATITVQNVGSGVLVVVNRNEYQDFNDSVGRY